MGGRRTHTDIWLETLEERSHFEDLGMDGKMLLQCILKMGQEGADRIQDKNRFRGVVNAVNLTLGGFCKVWGIILLAEGV